jgi:hypothetical protein
MINISLTIEDAELFREYRQHQDTFQALYNAGVFTTKNGSATIDFDSQGVLQQIRLNTCVYRKEKKMV